MENLQKQNLLVVMPKAVLMTSDGYEDFGDGAYRHTRLEKRFEDMASHSRDFSHELEA